MDSYQNPVNSPDPYDHYRVEGAQSQDQRPPPPDEEPPQDDQNIIRYLFQMISDKIAHFLSQLKSSQAAADPIRKSLVKLKEFFDTLQEEDRSQDLEFLNEFSKSWNEALEKTSQLSQGNGLQFKSFLKSVSHYPENEEHTLGYYLTEFAGQKWIPFPYMDLIQKIHQEHEKSPQTSPLSSWSKKLAELIRSLEEE